MRRFEAIHGGGILVENLCPVAIAIGQVGAAAGAGALLLSAGARQAFLLPAIPEHCPSATRQLRVASSAEALAAAVRGADGCVSSGSGWLHPGQDGPFAVTSGAAYQRPLTWPNGLQACVTIQVRTAAHSHPRQSIMKPQTTRQGGEGALRESMRPAVSVLLRDVAPRSG